MRRISVLILLVSLVLMLTSCHTAHVEDPLRQIRSDDTAIVWLAENATDADVARLGDDLRALSNIKSVEFISKEDALAAYADSIPDEAYEALQGENNPMLNGYKIVFKDVETADETLQEIEQLPYVDDVSYAVDTAKVVTEIPALLRYLYKLYDAVFG